MIDPRSQDTLKYTLFNLSPHVRPNPTYARGVLVGMVGAIMGCQNVGWRKAIAFLAPYFPPRVLGMAIPNEWMEEVARYTEIVSQLEYDMIGGLEKSHDDLSTEVA